MPHPSITSTGGDFRRDATNLRSLPPLKAIPGKVRLVKDLLRVGEWPIGMGADGTVQKWTVTPEVLTDIATVFERQKSEGQTRPLQWGHADPSTGNANVEPEKVIDYWDCLFAEGDTLWGVVYATEEDARKLTSVKRPVSVAVDYQGNILTPGTVTPVKNALLHVGIVDQGAMPGQGGFIQLAAKLEKSPMDFEAVKELINSMLGMVKDGLALPEEVTPENIVVVSKAIMAALGGAAATEEEAPEEETPAVGPTPPGADPMMAQMNARIAQLSASLAILTGQQAQTAESDFTKHIDALIGAGVPTTARESLINVGRANKWDIASVNGIVPASALVQLGSKITTLPASKADADLKEAVEQFTAAGYQPHKAKEMAKKSLGLV